VTDLSPLKRPRQSHIYAREVHGHYVDPSWCSARLLEVEEFVGSIWDPACGFGTIPEAARAAGHRYILATDIVDRGYQHFDYALDFLTAEISSDLPEHIVSNPPYHIAQEFVQRALRIARGKVCMLMPITWMLGKKRSRWLQSTPLVRVWLLCPRPSMPSGEYIRNGGKVGGGTRDFCWMVWSCSHVGPSTISWLRRDP
jgi:hypothetical protein